MGLCRFILLVFLMIVSNPLRAQSPSGFWSLQLENDLWGSNDDRFYTHGTKVSFVAAEAEPEYFSELRDLIPFYRAGETQIHGFEIGQTIFTPENIAEKNLIEEDRPYAGWLYFNLVIGDIFEDKGDRERMNFASTLR